MAKDSRDLSGASPEFLGAAWFDPIEAVIRDRVRGFIENLVEAGLDDALERPRFNVPAPRMWQAEPPAIGMCQLLGSFARSSWDSWTVSFSSAPQA